MSIYRLVMSIIVDGLVVLSSFILLFISLQSTLKEHKQKVFIKVLFILHLLIILSLMLFFYIRNI